MLRLPASTTPWREHSLPALNDHFRAALNQKLLSRRKRPTPMAGPNIVATTIITNDLPTITLRPRTSSYSTDLEDTHTASSHARTGTLKQIQPAPYFYTKKLFSSRVIPTLATFRSRVCECGFAQRHSHRLRYGEAKRRFSFNEMYDRCSSWPTAAKGAPAAARPEKQIHITVDNSSEDLRPPRTFMADDSRVRLIDRA